jgi:exosortase family protein XrtM
MRNPSLRFSVLFILFAGIGFYAEHAWYGPASKYVTRAYASVVAGAIDLVTPGQQVARVGAVLSSATRPIIEVTRECDGMSSFALLAAALLALPCSWRHKALGFILALALTAVCNFTRIASLFYVFKYFPNSAQTVHIYLGPLLIMLPSLAFFLYWSRPDPRYAPQSKSNAAPAA